MARNRFEQVDGPQEDAITLLLGKKEGGSVGAIHCPAACARGRLEEDKTSDEQPAKDAYRAAIKLANELKAPLVVADPDGIWDAEWGALYRAE
jgi:hypothetical protein